VYDTVPTRLFPTLRSPGAVSVAGDFNLDHVTIESIVSETRSWNLTRADTEAAVTETAEALQDAASGIDHEQLADLVATRAETLLDTAAGAMTTVASQFTENRSRPTSSSSVCEGVYDNGTKCTYQKKPGSNLCGRQHGRQH